MNCDEFLQILDERLNGDPPPSGWSDHAAACPRCALALRLERALKAAPRWAERPRLSAQARAEVIRQVGAAPLYWRRFATLAEESAATALAAAGIAAVAIYAGPALWAATVPEEARRALVPYLRPLSEGFRAAALSFEPLLRQGWGVALLGLTAFVVLFAAALSTRVLSPGRNA